MRVLFLFAVALAVAFADNSYVVVAPSKIRANMDLSVSVNILNATGNVDVTATILRGSTVVASGNGVFQQDTPGTVDIKLPADLPNAGYKLEVEGTGGLAFKDSASLTFNSKELSVFIQSNKAIYKPGDTVNFRAFAVYSDLKSFNGPMDISIYDAGANKIKQWVQESPVNGVITKSLTLSSQPVLGDWKIEVEASGSKVDKVFTVAEYVLPKFEVDVVMPSFVLSGDTDVTITVKAKYTYGKPVKGTADVSLKLLYSNYNYDYSRALPVTTTSVPVDGEAKISFPMANVKGINANLNKHILIVEANVSESLTGNSMSGNGTVTIYDKGVVLEWPESNPETFKPGLQYVAYLKVTQPDGLPLSVSTQKVTIKSRITAELPSVTPTPYYWYQAPTESRDLPQTQYDVPTNGLIAVPVDVPHDAKEAYVTAEFQGVSKQLKLSKSYSPSNSYIQLSLETSSALSAGDDISFKVKGTQPLDALVYQVLSRGGIVKTGTVNANSQQEFLFSIQSDASMAPNARIVVYYVRDDAEIVVDSISFDVDGAFENKVSISLNTTDTEPGNAVKVTVTADPSSAAHLLAIDQSVLLLKSGNDVTAEDVYTELKTYDTIKDKSSVIQPFFGGGAAIARKKRMIWWGWPVFYGGSDCQQIFKNAGVVVITDALVYHHQEPIRPLPVINVNPGGGWLGDILNVVQVASPIITSLVGSSSSSSSSKDLQEPARVRNVFSETWLWEDITTGYAMETSTIQLSPRPMPIFAFARRNLPLLAAGGPAGFPAVKALSADRTAPKSSGKDLQKPTRIRSNFAEVWLWQDIVTGANGTASVTTTVPDTITSWVASAFAINTASGLGVSPTQGHLTVFRPFFVSLNLPYSVTRGEQLALQAIVFNYLKTDQQVRVTLAKSNSFFNILVDSTGTESLEQNDAVQDITVTAGEAKSVFFPIVPADLGKIDVEIKAQSTQAADAVRRQLLVEAEGVPKEYNVPVVIDLTEGKTSYSETVDLNLPPNTVQGSELVRVSVVGDLMGPSIQGLDSLLRMPTGCGEQTMLGLAPDVYVTDYLKSVNQLSGDIETKALSYMESGYQRELTYKHKDGSFSAFGDNDDSGSMWLTAFVLKVFHEAKPYIFVDDEVVITALKWMISHQNTDGSFPEPGRVIHTNMQGQAAQGTGLTLFVLISLLENHDVLANTNAAGVLLDESAAKALAYAEAEVAKTDDLYILSLAAYAFQLAGSTQTQAVLDKLELKSTAKDGMRFWHQPETTKATTGSWHSPNPTQAVDTEMTAYVLQTYIARNDLVKAKNIMQWVVKQRNPNGGFQSTQDTVVALGALAAYAKLAYSNNFNVQVKAQLDADPTYDFTIDSSNSLLLQTRETKVVPAQVKIDATGSGMALAEIAVFFNVESEIEDTSFDLTVQLLEETLNYLVVETCAKWLGQGAASGMAVQEIGIPSGFDLDMESISELPTLKRVETQNKKIILYFDEIGTTATCLNFRADRTGLVAKSQPAAVRVYDYYAPENQITAFYQSQILKDSKISDICAECY